jgi:DNA-binding MarR family transcriptional regulator
VALTNGARTSSTDAEAAFRAVIRAFGLVERAMQSHFQGFGISGSQWGILRNLHRAEEAGESGLRLTDLSQRLLIRPPSVTGVVARLEQVGLVSRQSMTDDLRAKRVALTAAGRALVERVLEVHGKRIARLMAALTKTEQAELADLLTRLSDSLQAAAGPGG